MNLVTFLLLGLAAAALPTIDRIDAPRAIVQDSGTTFVQLTGLTSGDRNEGIRKVDVTSDNNNLLTVRVSHVQGTTTATLAIDPVPGQHGQAVVTVLVMDDNYEAITKSFVILVSPSAGDCEYGTWSVWGECSKRCNTGTKARTRTVIAEASFGGRACEQSLLLESLGCNRQACADPTLAFISDKLVVQDTPGPLEVYLSGISDGGNEGQMLRIEASTRDSNLIYDLEVDYTHPDQSAGLFYHLRPGVTGDVVVTVTVVDSEDAFTTRAFKLTILPEMRPYDCQWEWRAWTQCTSTCGTGVQSRNSRVIKAARNSGQQCPSPLPAEERTCNTNACPVRCELGWGSWSQCSATCGGGTMMRSQIVAVPASSGGASCPSIRSEEQQCGNAPCPVDCRFEWSDWSTCSKTCGTGSRSRQRRITQMSSRGGAACAGDAVEYQECGALQCPTDCQYAWGSWTGCSATCGGGTQTRREEITVLASNGGVPCQPESNRPTEQQACNLDACPYVPGPDDNSCVNSCGNIAPGGCGCDQTCTQYGDCCEDYVERCVAGPAAGSCLGRCGDATSDSLCWCDEFCNRNGDCCDDYERACASNSAGGSVPEYMKTCSNRCGKEDREEVKAASKDEDEDEGKSKNDKLKDMLLYQQLLGGGAGGGLLGGGGGAGAGATNPLLYASLLGGGDSDIGDMMMMQSLMGGGGQMDMSSMMMMQAAGGGKSNMMDMMLMQSMLTPPQQPQQQQPRPTLQRPGQLYSPVRVGTAPGYRAQTAPPPSTSMSPLLYASILGGGDSDMGDLMMANAMMGGQMDTNTMMMASMMGGGGGGMMSNPLMMSAMMGPEAMQPVLLARGMASMMSGEEMDEGEMVRAMMLTQTMDGSFNRAARDVGSDVGMRSVSMEEAAEEDGPAELPPVPFMGLDASFKSAARPAPSPAPTPKARGGFVLPPGFEAATGDDLMDRVFVEKAGGDAAPAEGEAVKNWAYYLDLYDKQQNAEDAAPPAPAPATSAPPAPTQTRYLSPAEVPRPTSSAFLTGLPSGRFTKDSFGPLYPATYPTYPSSLPAGLRPVGSRSQVITEYVPVPYTTSIRKPIVSTVLPYRPVFSAPAPVSQGLSAYEILLLSKLGGGGGGGGGGSGSSSVRKDEDENEDEVNAYAGACYCDKSCSKVGDCCEDYEALCESESRKGGGGGGGGGGLDKLALNALIGNPLGLGSIDPLTALAFGADPITALLVADQGNQGDKGNTCVNYCGVPGPIPLGGAPLQPYNPFVVNPYRARSQVGFRSTSLSGEDEEEASVPISTGFSNDAGLAVDFSPDDLAEAKEEELQADVQDRVVLLGGGTPPPRLQSGNARQCGCDPRCAVYGNCCQDYFDVCVRY